MDDERLADPQVTTASIISESFRVLHLPCGGHLFGRHAQLPPQCPGMERPHFPERNAPRENAATRLCNRNLCLLGFWTLSRSRFGPGHPLWWGLPWALWNVSSLFGLYPLGASSPFLPLPHPPVGTTKSVSGHFVGNITPLTSPPLLPGKNH